jgi:ATP-dependent DNA ligase
VGLFIWVRPSFAVFSDMVCQWHSSRCRCLVNLHLSTTQNGVFELKYDGFRALAILQNGRCQLISRNGHSFNSFADLRQSIPSELPHDGQTVLDGEIVCLDKRGRPQFRELLFHRAEPYFCAFDLLMDNGRDLRMERLADRKHELRRLLSKLPASPRLRYVDHVEQYGTALFHRVCKMDLEGIVAKHSFGPYTTERERTPHGSRSRTRNIRRWKGGKNCLGANATVSPHPAGILVN